MSPNYPNPYPENMYETWLITAPAGSSIVLKFNFFQVVTQFHNHLQEINLTLNYILF